MSTSLTSPALVFASDKAIIAARKEVAKASLFATDFSADAVQEGTTMKVPVFSPGQAKQFNRETNNYETVDGNVTYAPVTFDQHVKETFSFSDVDFTLVKGTNFWARAGEASGNAIAVAISAAVGALLVKSKVATEHVLASVTKANIAKIRAAMAAVGARADRSVVMLAPTQFADLLAALDANVYGGAEAIKNGVIPGLYGFKAIVENSDLSADSAEKLVGCVVPEDALVIAGRVVPVMSPNVYEEIGLTTDEVSGLTIGARRHGNPATGDNFCTHEALFGASLVQATKCVRLVSAATA